MSNGMLFSDVAINFDGTNLVCYGNSTDMCALERQELMRGKPVSQTNSVLGPIRGKLDGVPVVKFMNSGSVICLSFESLKKLMDDHPEAVETALSVLATEEEEDVTEES